MKTKINLDTGLISSLTSADPRHICFPYNWEAAPERDKDDILWEINVAVMERGFEIEEIQDFKVYALLKADDFLIGGAFQFKVSIEPSLHNLFRRKKFIKRLAANTDPEQVSATLQRFFKAGAPGLLDDFAICYGHQYDQYLQEQSSRKSSAMLKYLENGYTVDQVIQIFS